MNLLTHRKTCHLKVKKVIPEKIITKFATIDIETYPIPENEKQKLLVPYAIGIYASEEISMMDLNKLRI